MQNESFMKKIEHGNFINRAIKDEYTESKEVVQEEAKEAALGSGGFKTFKMQKSPVKGGNQS